MDLSQWDERKNRLSKLVVGRVGLCLASLALISTSLTDLEKLCLQDCFSLCLSPHRCYEPGWHA